MTAQDSVQFFFDGVCKELFRVRPRACSEAGTIYAFALTGPGGGAWTLDLGTRSVRHGEPLFSDCRLEMSVDDFYSMMMGTLNVPHAVDSGRLQVRGPPLAILKLGQLFQPLLS